MARLPESWIDKPEEAEIQSHVRSLVEITIAMSHIWHIDLIDIREGLSVEIKKEEQERADEAYRQAHRPPDGWEGRTF